MYLYTQADYAQADVQGDENYARSLVYLGLAGQPYGRILSACHRKNITTVSPYYNRHVLSQPQHFCSGSIRIRVIYSSSNLSVE